MLFPPIGEDSIVPQAAVTEPPAVIQTVTVTAARLPPSVGDAAFSIIRLNSDALAGQVRLDQGLQQVPGVSLFRRTSSAAANPTTQGISLRSIAGSGAGRALVTLDGVPQNDPFGGWVIWTALPTEAIEGASVVRGAGAGPYGAGALTGVVTLDELSRPGSLRVDAEGGGLGDRRGALATAQSVGSGEVFLSASGEHSDGWTPVRYGAGAADDRLSLSDWNVAARAQVPVGRALLAVRASAFQEDRQAGLVGAYSTATGKSASVTLAAQPTQDQLGYRLQAWVRSSGLQNTSVAVAAGRGATTPANNQYATPATGWGANAAVRGKVGAVVWEAGADARVASGQDEELFRFMGSAFTRNRVAGGKTLVAGGYGEVSVTAGPWLITGGGRIDGWETLGGHRVETDTTSHAITFQDHPADRSGTVPTGRIGIKRDLGDGLYVRTAAYAGFRPPTLNELYRPFRVGNDITEANATLKPERLYGAEAAFGGKTGALTWSAGGFYNQLEDAVTNVTIGVGPGIIAALPGAGFIPAGGTLRQRQNAGAIKAWGLETEATLHVSDRWSFHAAADYTHALVYGGLVAPQLTGLRPAQTPRVTVTAGATWQVAGPLSLGADLRYESSRFDDDQNSRLLTAATRVDARADWAFTRAASIYVAVDNLLDTDIQTGRTADGTVSYDEPRVVRAGLSVRY